MSKNIVPPKGRTCPPLVRTKNEQGDSPLVWKPILGIHRQLSTVFKKKTKTFANNPETQKTSQRFARNLHATQSVIASRRQSIVYPAPLAKGQLEDSSSLFSEPIFNPFSSPSLTLSLTPRFPPPAASQVQHPGAARSPGSHFPSPFSVPRPQPTVLAPPRCPTQFPAPNRLIPPLISASQPPRDSDRIPVGLCECPATHRPRRFENPRPSTMP